MSNMDLPPESSDSEYSDGDGAEREADRTAVGELASVGQQQIEPGGEANSNHISNEAAAASPSESDNAQEQGDMHVTSVLNTQESDKEASDEDVAAMSTLQQDHALQHMDDWIPAGSHCMPANNNDAKPAALDPGVAQTANVLQSLHIG